MTESKRGPGRPRKATPIKTKEGHSARVWVEREGEKIRTTVKLGTKSRTVARARGRRILEGEAPELVAEKSESFESHARRVLAASARKGKEKIESALERYAFPVIGDLPVADVTSDHILAVLADVEAEVGGWTGTVRNVRDFISLVLGSLEARRIVPFNEARRINFRSKDGLLGGKRIRKVYAPRPVLTDAEFEKLIAFLVTEATEGPKRRRTGALELLILALMARLFSMRTSDLHAWVWEMIDTASFLDAYVPRPKTDAELLDEADAAVVLEAWRDEPRSALPEAFGGWLRVWWLAMGSPSSGPVFGCRRGPRLGEQKKKTWYVRRLKAACWRAGVIRPLPGFELAATDEERQKLCVLQSGQPRRQSPLDFHSFRRAGATAAGKAVVTGELTLREAMVLTHHKDPAVFARYQAREARIVVPEKAVPTIMAAPPALLGGAASTPQPNLAAKSVPTRIDRSVRATPGRDDHVVSAGFWPAKEGSMGHETPHHTTERQNSPPVIETLGDALGLAMNLALKEGDIESAKALLSVIERRRAQAPDNVSSLDARRRKS